MTNNSLSFPQAFSGNPETRKCKIKEERFEDKNGKDKRQKSDEKRQMKKDNWKKTIENSKIQITINLKYQNTNNKRPATSNQQPETGNKYLIHRSKFSEIPKQLVIEKNKFHRT